MIYAPPARAYLALPVHVNAGVSAPRLGSLFDLGGELLGGVLGGMFGGSSQERALKNQRKMVEAQLHAARDIAGMQRDVGMAQIDAAVQTARIQAANELAAIDSAYAAHLSAMRTQKAVAEDALSTQLVAQTQSGVFGLARSGIEQSASIARTFPRTGAAMAVLLVLGGAYAISKMKTSGGRREQARKKSWRKGGWKKRKAWGSPADSSASPFSSSVASPVAA